MAVLKFGSPRNQAEIGYARFLEKVVTVVIRKPCTPKAGTETLERMFGINADEKIVVATLDYLHAMGYLEKNGETYKLAKCW